MIYETPQEDKKTFIQTHNTAAMRARYTIACGREPMSAAAYVERCLTDCDDSVRPSSPPTTFDTVSVI